MQLPAPAKVNLSFRILGARGDGYHEVETLIVPLTLCDQLRFEKSQNGGITFDCDDPSLPTGDDNLVIRAARRFLDAAGNGRGVHIRLGKQIPHGAGLGGGSSDAATTLLGLNELLGAPLSADALHKIGAAIGSDVPFFLLRSAALCRGRGELVTACKLATGFRFLLAKPDFGVPTPEAYARLKNARPLPGVDYEPQEFSGVTFVNDLELPVFEKYPFLGRLKTWLREQPEVGAALLSGSGSTVFGALRDAAGAEHLAARLRGELDPKIWTRVVETAG